MISHDYFMDKESMCAIGHALWQVRQEKRLHLDRVQKDTHIPQRVIDGIEIGRHLNYGVLRKLLIYYGRSIKITLE